MDKIEMSHTEQTAYFALLREGIVVVNPILLSKILKISLDWARKLLNRLMHKGILSHIGKGKYVVISSDVLHKRKSFINDPQFVVDQLMAIEKKEYYLAYLSAAHLYGILHQLPFVTQVALLKRHQTIKLGNTKIQFITIQKRKFFGVTEMKYGENLIRVSDLEKTLIDCLDRFDLCGGIEEVARTISSAIDRVNGKKIIKYIKQMDNQSLTQRMGFILEKLEKKGIHIPENIIEKLSTMGNFIPCLLDPHSPRRGKKSEKWNLIENVDITPGLGC